MLTALQDTLTSIRSQSFRTIEVSKEYTNMGLTDAALHTAEVADLLNIAADLLEENYEDVEENIEEESEVQG